ncbi:MAG TPA: hypothetical protein VMI54_26850 [Polyangiaceae bacterium]|nr:hypothetical protein [Polyangiaceae bacterium]
MRTNSPWATTREPLGRRDGEAVGAKLLARVGDAAPYFALEDCVFDGAELRARAASETDPGTELGTASSAEIARHALVAGSGCLALGRPSDGRSYYLVSSIDGTFFTGSAPFGTPIHYSAIATAEGPVGGAAQVEARLASELVARLRVTYAVVEEALFARLFAAQRTATFGDTGSYASYPPFVSCVHDGNVARATLAVDTSACHGHFHQYPTLPATTLLGQLVRLTSRLVPTRFRVSALRLRTPALAWAGDELELRMERVPGPWNFSGHATTGGRVVASLDLGVVSGFSS